MRPGAPPLFPGLVSRGLAIIVPTAAAKACACCAGINGERRGLAKRGANRKRVDRPPFRLGGAAGKSVHFRGKGLHTARLMGEKAVRFAPGDSKIGLQQGRAAKHKLKQTRGPPNIDAEGDRRAKKNNCAQACQQIHMSFEPIRD